MVLKPGDGVASEDVVRVSGPAEVELRCAELFARHPDRELLAEEFLPGTLQTVETLGDGVTRWVLGGFRTTVSPPYFAEERLTWDPPGAAADGHVSAALDALGVSFGACHTEYVSGPAVRLIEVNDRLIGDHCDFLLAHVLGLPLFELVLRVHLGERLPPVMPAAPPGRTHAIADYVIAERRGVLAVVPPAARHDVGLPWRDARALAAARARRARHRNRQQSRLPGRHLRGGAGRGKVSRTLYASYAVGRAGRSGHGAGAGT